MTATRQRSVVAALSRLAPGLAVAVALAVVALVAGAVQQRLLGHVLIEPLVVALLLGVVVGNAWSRTDALAAGTAFAAKEVLEVAVVVLGMTLDFQQVLTAGAGILLLIVTGVAAAIAVGYAIGRALGLGQKLAVLVAVGNAICGNSAIAAVAPIIGAAKKDVASAIALTAVIGVCLVIGLPFLIPILGIDHYQYGVVAGMGIYSVPQVVAASFPVSQLAGQVATLVKLIRVLLLGPVVVLVSLGARRADRDGAGRRPWTSYVPWFVAGFLLLAVVRNIGLVPAPLVGGARETTSLLMTISMAGLGYGVRLADVRGVGLRVGGSVVGALTFMIVTTLVLIQLLGIRA